MFSGALDTSLNVEYFVCNKSTPSTHDVNCQTSNLELFCKNSQKRKTIHYFCNNLHLGCLKRFWICFWIGFQSYGCFIFETIWISQVADNLAKTKKKRQLNLTLPNIIEIFQNTSRTFIFHVAASRVLSAHLTPALFCSRGIFRTPSNI